MIAKLRSLFSEPASEDPSLKRVLREERHILLSLLEGLLLAGLSWALIPVQYDTLRIILILFFLVLTFLLVGLFTLSLRKELKRLEAVLHQRRTDEVTLREAEMFYRTLVEQSSVVIYRDIPDLMGSSLFVSPQIKDLIGYTAEEWMQTPTYWQNLVHPDDLPKVLADIAKYEQTGNTVVDEYRLRTKDGRWIWVRDETAIVRDDQGQIRYVLGVMYDITPRKEAERILQQRGKILQSVAKSGQQFLQNLDWRQFIDSTLRELGLAMEASHAYLFEIHPLPDGTQAHSLTHEWSNTGYHSEVGNPLYVNRPLSREDNRDWYDRLSRGEAFVKHRPMIPDFEPAWKSVCEVPIFVEDRWWGTIGFDDYEEEREWLQVEIDVLKLAASVISAAVQRQQSDLALLERDRLYHQAIEVAGAVPYRLVHNKPARYSFMGEGIRQLSGYGPEEMTPELWGAITQEIVLRGEGAGLDFEEAARRVQDGQIKIWNSDSRILRRDGQMRWINDVAIEVLSKSGGPLISIGILQDITGRVKAQEVLEQRVEERTIQLQASNQMLNQEKARLELYNQQRITLAAMIDLLQAASTINEAALIVATHISLLFPEHSGALYQNTPPNLLTPVSNWGEGKDALTHGFTSHDCWALRRGRTYHSGEASPNPLCRHNKGANHHDAWCIPLSAQGESLGLLHLVKSAYPNGTPSHPVEEGFMASVADSIALSLANLHLREGLRIQSIRDSLTGLFNRRYLDETLPREMHRAGRQKSPLSILMLDIDHFKKFNDKYGHDAGDVVLKSLASLIQSCFRSSDIACRYGGEEFTIVLLETPVEKALQRAEELRMATAQLPLRHESHDLGSVTLSIGVATFPIHGQSRDALIKSADTALYQAKTNGRNQVVIAS